MAFPQYEINPHRFRWRHSFDPGIFVLLHIDDNNIGTFESEEPRNCFQVNFPMNEMRIVQ